MKCFPDREWVFFFCLTSSRGNLHVVLSSSVPLILPLILHCPRVKPKVHIQTKPGQQSRGYQSMKWKKKTTPSPSLSLTKPQWNSTAPDEADKVADQLLEMVSGPQNAVEREYTLTEVQLKNTSTAAGKTNYTTAGDMNLHSGYTAGQCDLCTEQFLITRVNLLIYGLNFYTLYSLNLACAFRSSNYHHHKWNVTLFVFLLCIYILFFYCIC